MADDQAAKLADYLGRELANAAKELILEITANLQEATPVDTGHARANWVPSVGAPYTGEAMDGSANDAGVAQVLAFRLGQGDLSISNNVPYINRLIAGSSSQAPAGWDLRAIDQGLATVQSRHDGLKIQVGEGGLEATVTVTPRVPGAGG